MPQVKHHVFQSSKSEKQIALWLLTGCFMVFVMTVLGGTTRLTGSGLSITEWNVLMGALPPLNGQDWQVLYQKYTLSPQFQKVNYHMDVEAFKSIFWWEYIHRLWGRLIGVAFIIPFCYFLFTGKFKAQRITKRLVTLFLLGGLQGLVGWFMVQSGLQENPHVSHYRLATHLTMAFLVYGFMWWFVLELLYPPAAGESTAETASHKKIRSAARLLTGIVLLQIIYGAFVAGLHAGTMYNTFPKMGDEWIPSAMAPLSPGWINLLEDRTTVQFIHRLLAYLIVILTVYIFIVSLRANLSSMQRKAVFLLDTAVTLQVVLGIVTLLMSVPVIMGVLHQAGALLLFTALVFLLFLFRKSTERP